MPKDDANRGLLFGLLALQNGLVVPADLISAFRVWSSDRSRTLDRVLVDRGVLTEDQRALLENLDDMAIGERGGGIGANPAALDTSREDRGGTAGFVEPEFEATQAYSRPASPGIGDIEAGRIATPAGEAQRFRVLRPHSRGGLGTVSVALDTELKREVALKQIRPGRAEDPASRARFVREAEVTGRLEHPGVVPIYGLGQDVGGRPYYAMRLIQGESLWEAILQFHREARGDFGRHSLRFRKLLGAFVAACQAIHYAHSRGVIHRDIKPANIMLGPFGETLVVDWGLAKPTGGAAEVGEGDGVGSYPLGPLPDPISGGVGVQTLDGSAIGTPAYMSPEQAAGDHGRVGPASDVYGLGATLHCLLTGRPPFDRDDLERLLGRIRRGEFDPPRRINPALDPMLEAISRKAMATRPEDRHGSALQLAEDVERWLADEPIPSLPEPLGRRLSRWERRNRVLIRACGAALILVTIVSVGAALVVAASRAEERRLRIEAVRQEALADDRRREAEGRSLELQRQSARMDMDRGLMLCEQGEVARGVNWLARSLGLVPASDLELSRQIRINLAGWDDRLFPLRAHLAHGGKVHSAAFSRDGVRVVTASNDHTARVWDAATGRPLTPPLVHNAPVNRAAFSPDGTRVATASDDHTARVWDAATGRPLGPPLVHRDWVNFAVFSPDGSRLITASDDHTARVWDAASGRPLGPPLEHDKAVNIAEFSPDGARVATAGDEGTTRVWDAATGRPLAPAMRHAEAVKHLAFSPDGARIATASLDRTARIWDLATGRPLTPPLTHQGAVNSVAFSPDGIRLLTASEDHMARVWDAATGRPLGTPLIHRGGVISAAFRADGARISTASQDKTARVWDAATGRPLGSPVEHRDWIYSAQFSTDGSRLLTASRDFTARVWDLGPGPARSVHLAHVGAVNAATFTRDGARVATAGSDGTARIWEASTGRLMAPPLVHRGPLHWVDFRPDGLRLVAAGQSYQALVWDVATSRSLTSAEAMTHGAWINRVAFSHDGSKVVTASDDGTARLWDAETGRSLGPPMAHLGAVYSATFSADDSRILSAGRDRLARIWDAKTCRPVGPTLEHNSEVLGAAFSPDSTRILTSSMDGVARIWDAASGRLLGRPLEERSLIRTAAFSPDGGRLLTLSPSGEVRVWDAATGRPLGPPIEQDPALKSAALSPDGARVVTARDGGASVWELPRPLPIDPELVADWARSRTGMALDDLGGVTVLDGPTWAAARQRLSRTAHEGAD